MESIAHCGEPDTDIWSNCMGEQLVTHETQAPWRVKSGPLAPGSDSVETPTRYWHDHGNHRMLIGLYDEWFCRSSLRQENLQLSLSIRRAPEDQYYG